jgi:glycosyltransferase involved in cell wall biosynthesis
MVGLSGGNFSHRDYFLKHGIDKSRVFTLPMVVNNQRFEHLKVSCFHPEGVVKFIYIGNLIPLKRVDKIISAFIELPFENCSLMIIGDGPEEEKLKRLARDDERIVFKGRVENRKIGQYLSKSHYLVLASIKEMWGLVINEALASGTIPLISKNVGCKDDFSHLLEDWMVFDGEDFFSIVECFIKAVKFDEYTATAEKAQRFMIENWNYNLYINNLLHALEQIEMLRKRGL